MNPIYLYLDKDLKVHAKEVSFDFVFNTTLKNSDLEFQFEKNMNHTNSMLMMT